MPKPLDPILGPDGKRLWVTAREYIGAEEVNAACEWTQRVHRALTREHSDGDMYGHHKRAFHPIGAVRFLMPRWVSGSAQPGRIYPDSFLLGRTEREFPGTFGISAVSFGVFRIFMNPLLPTTKYWVQVHGQPHPIAGGYRRFRFNYQNRFLNSFELEAYGVPATGAANGFSRVPLIAVIYAETRP